MDLSRFVAVPLKKKGMLESSKCMTLCAYELFEIKIGCIFLIQFL